MAEINFLPRTVPLLLMVAGVVVAPRHLARPVESMLVLPGAEVDHVPKRIRSEWTIAADAGDGGKLDLVIRRGRKMVRDGA